MDLWLIDVARNVPRRLTFNNALDDGPVWSPDGNRLAFTSRQKLGNKNIYIKSVNGAGNEELLVESTENKFTQDWSSDGRFLLYATSSAKTASDLWALTLADKKSFPIVSTNADEADGRFSPDGKWIVFDSNETGRYEIYIQPFPGPAAKSAPISTNGGTLPQWSRDGKEIFFLGLDNRLMAVPVTLRSNGTVESGTPTALFHMRPRSEFEASQDGRFLVRAPTEDASSTPITVVLNWASRKK
jgi:Tol biopolymer transport system component